MEIYLAEKIQSLMNRLDELKFLKHGLYKNMLSKEIINQKVLEYDKEIAEIEKEIENL